MFKGRVIEGLIIIGCLSLWVASGWGMGKKPVRSEQSAVSSEEKAQAVVKGEAQAEVKENPEVAEAKSEPNKAKSTEQKGTQTVLVEVQKQVQIQHIEWSPTKNEIVYITADNEKKGNIWVMDLNSGKRKLLIDKGYSYSKPLWSPDGEKIVCDIADSMYTGPDKEMISHYLSLGNIWVIDIEGGTKTQLPLNNKYSHINPIWSPDGKKIAYSSTEDCSYKVKLKSGQETMKLAYGLHIMDADGSNRRVLTIPKYDICEDIPIAWAPDGKRIVYYAGGSERTDMGIYSIDINGKGKKQIVSYVWDYDVSPKTEKIIYISPKDSNIWITNFDASYKKQITSDTIDKGSVQWVSSQEIIAKFWEFDTNGDGRISRDDVSTLKAINLDTQNIKILGRDEIRKIKISSKTGKVAVVKDNKIIVTDSLSNLIVKQDEGGG